MNKNQFFIVGAQRSGTTYLYTILDEHPEICMAKPVKPEPKYFLNNKYNEIEYYNNFYTHKTNSTKIFGEKSTSYYESKSIAQKIATNIPLAKIIFILADPVDRAISNYKLSFENGLETRSIEDVFINNVPIDSSKYDTSVNPFDYNQRGIYHQYIEYYYDYFPRENIKVIIKEEFIANQEKIGELYEFLGVDKKFIPESLNKVINKSQKKIDIPSSVLESLSQYYKQSNKQLEELLSREFLLWL